MMNKFWLLLLTVLVSTNGFAQNDEDYDPLVIIAKEKDGNTLLKMVPLHPDTWLKSTQAGFMVERAPITDGDTGTFEQLNQEPIMPATREAWDELANEVKEAQYARQMLYDEAQQTVPQTFDQKYAAANRLDQRHFFYLFFTTRHRQVSAASGMEWLDETAEADQNYIYRVRVANHPDNERYTAARTIRQDQLVKVPSPRLEGQGVEKAVQLRWRHEGYENIFFSYDIERSADGDNYEVLNEAPLLYNKNRQTPRMTPGLMHFTDSLDQNFQPYFYRVVATDFFGDRHEPSEAVKVMGRDRTPPKAPFNINTTSTNEGIKISWDYIANADDLTGFYVVHSANDISGPFDRIHKDPLPTTARSYIDRDVDKSGKNYYMVLAVDTAKNISASLAAYAFIPDTIPPAAPTGLQYEVDTNGVLKLQWAEGEEDDIKGYRVFRSVNKKFDMVQQSKLPVMAHQFIDTLPMKTLDEIYYYRIVALDRNHNHSAYSDFLEVKKPDLIPPTKPLLTGLNWQKDRMMVAFVSSASEDVEAHQIYRKAAGSKEWQKVEKVGPEENRYEDQFKPTSQYYDYKIQAQDDDGHTSEFSNVKRARVLLPDVLEPVGQVEVESHPERGILVNWQYPAETKDQLRFIIYRSVGEGPLTMYRSVGGGSQTFRDFAVDAGTRYNYAVRVQDGHGQKSAMSSVTSIELE